MQSKSNSNPPSPTNRPKLDPLKEPKIVTDFPAAHSMDTTWFAIDADGYVGIFDTSEGGAMPEDLTPFHPESIQFPSDLLAILAADNGKLIDRSAVNIDFILEKIYQ